MIYFFVFHFWGRGAHVCMHVWMGSTHVWVHMHMFVHACEGLRLMPGLILGCSSTLFEKAGCLSQAQSSLIGQDSLASLLWGCSVSTSLGVLTGGLLRPPGIPGESGTPSSGPPTCTAMHLNHRALSPAQKMNFNRQSYKVTMSLYWNVTAIVYQRSSLLSSLF